MAMLGSGCAAAVCWEAYREERNHTRETGCDEIERGLEDEPRDDWIANGGVECFIGVGCQFILADDAGDEGAISCQHSNADRERDFCLRLT